MTKKETLKRIVFSVYNQLIIKRKQEINFWIFYSFIVMFVLARMTVYLVPNFFTVINETHIHHFAYGFFMLGVAGFLSLNDFHIKYPRFVAILYGWGLAWAIDEFGMWIHLSDDYWIRKSYDAVMIVGGALFSFVYFANFWHVLFARINTYLLKNILKTVKFVIKKSPIK